MSLMRYIVKENINLDTLDFLGYHSSKQKNLEGFTATYYFHDDHIQRIREIYYHSISYNSEYYRSDFPSNEWDSEDDIIDFMNEAINEEGYRVTYVSTEPIKASNFQAGKYKYGDYLYKVYGKPNTYHIIYDPVEINAEIIIYKEEHPLYFKPLEE